MQYFTQDLYESDIVPDDRVNLVLVRSLRRDGREGNEEDDDEDSLADDYDVAMNGKVYRVN